MNPIPTACGRHYGLNCVCGINRCERCATFLDAFMDYCFADGQGYADDWYLSRLSFNLSMAALLTIARNQ